MGKNGLNIKNEGNWLPNSNSSTPNYHSTSIVVYMKKLKFYLILTHFQGIKAPNWGFVGGGGGKNGLNIKNEGNWLLNSNSPTPNYHVYIHCGLYEEK